MPGQPPQHAQPQQYGTPEQHAQAQQYGLPEQHAQPPQYAPPAEHGQTRQFGTPPLPPGPADDEQAGRPGGATASGEGEQHPGS
jgi:hypothetical protein